MTEISNNLITSKRNFKIDIWLLDIICNLVLVI